MKAKEYPSQEYIKSLFEYRDGGLYRLTNIRNGANGKIGDRAGSLHKRTGYRKVIIDYASYLEHRIIWIMFFGEIPDGYMLDHINRIKNDNRIENLRLVDKSLNQMNCNSKNVMEREWLGGSISYRGRYKINGKEFSKTFHTEQEASEWVAQKKSEIFQNFQESRA